MGRKWKARQAANEAIEKARSGGNSSGEQKEPRFVCHVRTCHMESEVDEKVPVRERAMSHCIAFHIMKQ